MKEKFVGFVEPVRLYWSNTTKKNKLLYLGVLAAVLVVSLILVMMLNRKDYVVLYDDLASTDIAMVIQTLEEMGVETKLDGGKLYVPKDSQDAALMSMATLGYTDSGLTLDIFERGNGLTATQSDKQKYEIYQLQSRLESTIKTIPEVKNAVVNISVPQQNSFVLQEDAISPTASIMLDTKSLKSISADQVKGILLLVQNAVPGLTEENISIVDRNGDLKASLDLAGNSNSSKLALTEQVNTAVRNRILTILQPVYGLDNVQVAVSSDLDINTMVTEDTTYRPFDEEDPTRNPLDYSEYMEDRSGGNAIAEGVAGANDNIDVPQYGAEDGVNNPSEYYSTHRIYDYLVSSTWNQIVKEGYDTIDLQATVVINTQALSDAERDQVIDMVANAAGVPRDKVSVQGMPFLQANDTITGPFTRDEDGNLSRTFIFTIVGIVALLIILLAVLLFLRNRRKQKALAAEGLYFDESGPLLELGADGEPLEEAFEPIELVETQEQKLKAQIKDLAQSDPEIVAQLLKTWLMTS